jgi:PKD repeat protein
MNIPCDLKICRIILTILTIDLLIFNIFCRGTSSNEGTHNGGGMLFGNDGKLYLTTGDGGTRKNANDLSILHGKVIRINSDGSIPDDNPFVGRFESYHCSQSGGKVPNNASNNAVCSEIWAYGLRNPFRIAADPRETDKTKFIISDVGGTTWEELSYAGTDYSGVNYGFPTREGPCEYQSQTRCAIPTDSDYIDPFHYYSHNKDGSAAVSASAFVPAYVEWPEEYEFLFADFVFQAIYSLTEDATRECRTCIPPVSGYRNSSFFHSTADPGNDFSAARIVDIFFGPYQDSYALYVVRFGSAYENFDTILRIRYTGIDNDPPLAVLDVKDKHFKVGEVIQFQGSNSIDPEGHTLSFRWFFGDGSESFEEDPSHSYNTTGHYKVTMIITDSFGQSQQTIRTITVGDPPIPTMISPEKGTTFSVGDVFRLNGKASYPNGTSLDESYIEWSARKYQ